MGDQLSSRGDDGREPRRFRSSSIKPDHCASDPIHDDQVRESLLRLARELTGSLTLKEVGRLLAWESRKLFGHDAFYCDIYDETRGMLLGVYAEDTLPGGREPVEACMPSDTPPAINLLDSLEGRAALYNRPDTSPQWQLSPFGETNRHSQSLMFAPVIWKGKAVGVISAQSYTANRYGPKDLELLQAFADQLGGVLARMRVEEALRESETRYRRLVESSPDAILVLQDERCCLASEAFTRLFGYGQADLERSLSFLDLVKESDHEATMDRYRDRISGKSLSALYELDLVAKDGTCVPCEISSTRIDYHGRPAIMVVIRDQRERRRVEQIRETLRRLSQELTGPLTLAEIGKKLSAESRRLFGHDAFLCEVYDETRHALSRAYMEDTEEGATEPKEVSDQRGPQTDEEFFGFVSNLPLLINRTDEDSGGELRPFGHKSRRSRSLMFVPVRWQGRVIGMLTTQSYAPNRYSRQDLDLLQLLADQVGGAMARVRVEEAIRRLNEELEQRVRQRTAELEASQEKLRAVERLASLGTLAAGIAHEINNPIGTVLLAAQLAVQRLPEGEEWLFVRDRFAEIVADAQRCGEVVKGVLQFARQEPARQWPADLNQATGEAVRMATHYAGESGVEITLDCDRTIPAVLMNPTEVEQVLVNLLRNAIESRPIDGRVAVCTRLAGQTALIVVEDRGCGMSEQHCRRVFDPFFTTRQQQGGLGLGLSISHGIVSRYGGSIDIVSHPGRGTTVTVKLPIRPLEPPRDG